jgi:ribulose kinase
MRTARLLVGVPLLALGIAVAVPGMRAVPAHGADIEEMISSAKTPADHEAIASYYEGQAKEARQKAEEHRKMGEAYKKGGGALAAKTHFHEHCEALTRSYNAEAKEYEALAASHRDMAKHAK